MLEYEHKAQFLRIIIRINIFVSPFQGAIFSKHLWTCGYPNQWATKFCHQVSRKKFKFLLYFWTKKIIFFNHPESSKSLVNCSAGHFWSKLRVWVQKGRPYASGVKIETPLFVLTISVLARRFLNSSSGRRCKSWGHMKFFFIVLTVRGSQGE